MMSTSAFDAADVFLPAMRTTTLPKNGGKIHGIR